MQMEMMTPLRTSSRIIARRLVEAMSVYTCDIAAMQQGFTNAQKGC
jgi:hypothetical protein